MKATDFGPPLPRHPQQTWLEAFAAECRHVSGPELVQWLTEMGPADPARAVVEGELDRRDALPRLADDDPDCIPSGAIL